MMYIDFSVGCNNYKLRLNTRAIIALEKQIGCNPLAIFGAGDTIPTITTMVAILHQSMQQYQHGITMDKAFDIFDEWLGEGNATTDFIPLILEVYRVSGIIKNDREDTEKN